jgi:hypothetical protein
LLRYYEDILLTLFFCCQLRISSCSFKTFSSVSTDWKVGFQPCCRLRLTNQRRRWYCRKRVMWGYIPSCSDREVSYLSLVCHTQIWNNVLGCERALLSFMHESSVKCNPWVQNYLYTYILYLIDAYVCAYCFSKYTSVYRTK